MMCRLLVLLLNWFIFYNLSAVYADESSLEITCSDLKGEAYGVGSFLYYTGSWTRRDITVVFYLSTRKHREPVEVIKGDSEELKQSGFDPSLPTFVIIHGFKSGGNKKWVLDLKNSLLDTVDGNVIQVDWSDGSNTKNYVNAARNTVLVTNKIFNFLQTIRPQVQKLNGFSKHMKWNHLHFIGHSLGAQISGQTSHLLKQDTFWKVDRITGLDPAKPCFVQTGVGLRLDRGDAEYVDVIHTQIGNGEMAFGFRDNIGHADFYVNGGTEQPECLSGGIMSMLTGDLNKMICSHKLAYTYFTESLHKPSICSFPSYHWDGSYREAQSILKKQLSGEFCKSCPPMGINASKSRETGVFLVLTSTKQPHCQLEQNDVKKVFKVIRNLKGKLSIFQS